jgi:hypothetical protein
MNPIFESWSDFICWVLVMLSVYSASFGALWGSRHDEELVLLVCWTFEHALGLSAS